MGSATTTDDGRTRARGRHDLVRHDGRGPSLVFVHGGWLNGRTWRSQVEHFADEYRIVTVDVRGHGYTGSTDPKRYSVELFADDLEAVCAELDLERPIFCGLSLGSMVVQEYLARHPDRATGDPPVRSDRCPRWPFRRR